MSTAVSHAACGRRAFFISFIDWNKKLAILFDLSRPGKGQILWSFAFMIFVLSFTAKIYVVGCICSN